MRSLTVFSAVLAVVFYVIPVTSAGAQSRVCAGSCDEFGNPVYDTTPRLPEGGQLYDPGFPGQYDRRYVGQPDYRYAPQPRYNYRTERRYRKRYRHRTRRHARRHTNRGYRYRSHRRTYHRPVYRDPYAGRTEFCRDTIERRGYGWHSKRVNVRRCVWVRNDLVPSYGTFSSSDW